MIEVGLGHVASSSAEPSAIEQKRAASRDALFAFAAFIAERLSFVLACRAADARSASNGGTLRVRQRGAGLHNGCCRRAELVGSGARIRRGSQQRDARDERTQCTREPRMKAKHRGVVCELSRGAAKGVAFFARLLAVTALCLD